MFRRIVALLLILAMFTGLGGARKALVIGNSAYEGKQALKNPRNDAEDISSALKDLGFSVTTVFDQPLRGFKDSVVSFTNTLSPVDDVVFYYSGHGAQYAGENYLLPIGAFISSPADYEYETVSATWTLRRMAVARITIFILDACRNDPSTRSFRETKGLTKIEPQNGIQYVIYSTEKDTEALDGSGRNSPFAESFVRNLRGSTKKVEDMMKDVRSEVRRATSNQQTPTVYGILEEDFYFNNSVAPIEAKTVVPAPSAPKPQIETVWVYGSLEVESDSAGDLYLDGEMQQNLSPGQKAIIRLVTGEHLVEFKTGQANQSQKINLQKEQTLSVSFAFIPKAQQPKPTQVTPPQAKPQPQKVAPPSNLVLVEGGKFIMGSNDNEPDARPPHEVSLKSFYIAKTEITQKEWREVMKINPSSFKGEDRPVDSVTWYDAIEYCNLLSSKENLTPCYTINKKVKDPNNKNDQDKFNWTVRVNWEADGYRLPTEAEWEYAARGGKLSKGYYYSGANDPESIAWFLMNAGSMGSKHPDYGTHKVGTKAPNELGLFDMNGNVWEWCWDWYGEDFYAKSPSTDPNGLLSGSSRVLRGGGWDFNEVDCFTRNSLSPSSKYDNIGFRVVRSIKQAPQTEGTH